MEQVQPSIDSMNETIAVFMGAVEMKDDYGEIGLKSETFIGWNKHILKESLQYHNSWGWVMPVWIKFRNLALDNKEFSDWCSSLGWYLYCANEPKTFHERMYYAIVWYNKQISKSDQQKQSI